MRRAVRLLVVLLALLLIPAFVSADIDRVLQQVPEDDRFLLDTDRAQMVRVYDGFGTARDTHYLYVPHREGDSGNSYKIYAHGWRGDALIETTPGVSHSDFTSTVTSVSSDNDIQVYNQQRNSQRISSSELRGEDYNNYIQSYLDYDTDYQYTLNPVFGTGGSNFGPGPVTHYELNEQRLIDGDWHPVGSSYEQEDGRIYRVVSSQEDSDALSPRYVEYDTGERTVILNPGETIEEDGTRYRVSTVNDGEIEPDAYRVNHPNRGAEWVSVEDYESGEFVVDGVTVYYDSETGMFSDSYTDREFLRDERGFLLENRYGLSADQEYTIISREGEDEHYYIEAGEDIPEGYEIVLGAEGVDANRVNAFSDLASFSGTLSEPELDEGPGEEPPADSSPSAPPAPGSDTDDQDDSDHWQTLERELETEVVAQQQVDLAQETSITGSAQNHQTGGVTLQKYELSEGKTLYIDPDGEMRIVGAGGLEELSSNEQQAYQSRIEEHDRAVAQFGENFRGTSYEDGEFTVRIEEDNRVIPLRRTQGVGGEDVEIYATDAGQVYAVDNGDGTPLHSLIREGMHLEKETNELYYQDSKVESVSSQGRVNLAHSGFVEADAEQFSQRIIEDRGGYYVQNSVYHRVIDGQVDQSTYLVESSSGEDLEELERRELHVISEERKVNVELGGETSVFEGDGSLRESGQDVLREAKALSQFGDNTILSGRYTEDDKFVSSARTQEHTWGMAGTTGGNEIRRLTNPETDEFEGWSRDHSHGALASDSYTRVVREDGTVEYYDGPIEDNNLQRRETPDGTITSGDTTYQRLEGGQISINGGVTVTEGNIIRHNGVDYRRSGLFNRGEYRDEDGNELNEDVVRQVQEAKDDEQQQSIRDSLEVLSEQSTDQRIFASIQVASEGARGAHGYSSLFMSQEEIASWRESVDKTFAELRLGSDYWASDICGGASSLTTSLGGQQVAFGFGPNPYAQTSPAGSVRVAASCSAERQIIDDPLSGREYLYKVEFFVRNTGTAPMDFNVDLVGDPTQPLFEEDMELEAGRTFSRAGRSAFVAYSTKEYTQCCVQLKNAPPLAAGSERTCNKVVDLDTTPLVLERGTPAVGGGQEGESGGVPNYNENI